MAWILSEKNLLINCEYIKNAFVLKAKESLIDSLVEDEIKFSLIVIDLEGNPYLVCQDDSERVLLKLLIIIFDTEDEDRNIIYINIEKNKLKQLEIAKKRKT